LTPKQTQALEVLDTSDVEELLYGGAKGGGKSVFGCYASLINALRIINHCKIEQNQIHPIPIGFLGRKRSTDFTKTTLETWKRFIPQSLYRIREQEIIIDDKVKYFFGGLDDQKTINKFNSAEFQWVFVDQAEEINRTDLGLLRGTLRLIINGIKPKYKILLTSNPAECFLRQDFIYAPEKNARFIQALPYDNPFLGEEYVQRLRQAFKHRPELVKAYVEGSWDELAGGDILIKHSWVLRAVNNNIRIANDRRVTACDVARLGGDETVIYNMVDGKVTDQLIYGDKETTYTAAQIIKMANMNNSDIIAIDACGMGGPVCDMVNNLIMNNGGKVRLLQINSASNADNDERFANLRAEMWFYAADKIAEGQASIPNDQELIGQLSSVKYNPNGSGGRFLIEKKDEIKKRLDRSPDRADCFVYGLWATSKVAKDQIDFGRSNDVESAGRSGYGWERIYQGNANSYGWEN
jgi:PBSX family phage terminase large subunit